MNTDTENMNTDTENMNTDTEGKDYWPPPPAGPQQIIHSCKIYKNSILY